MIAEAQGEHERLITETEVYRTAVDRADELGARAHADSARMRAEVDEYVDTRLADFGTDARADAPLGREGPHHPARVAAVASDHPARGVRRGLAGPVRPLARPRPR